MEVLATSFHVFFLSGNKVNDAIGEKEEKDVLKGISFAQLKPGTGKLYTGVFILLYFRVKIPVKKNT